MQEYNFSTKTINNQQHTLIINVKAKTFKEAENKANKYIKDIHLEKYIKIDKDITNEVNQ